MLLTTKLFVCVRINYCTLCVHGYVINSALQVESDHQMLKGYA